MGNEQSVVSQSSGKECVKYEIRPVEKTMTNIVRALIFKGIIVAESLGSIYLVTKGYSQIVIWAVGLLLELLGCIGSGIIDWLKKSQENNICVIICDEIHKSNLPTISFIKEVVKRALEFLQRLVLLGRALQN